MEKFAVSSLRQTRPNSINKVLLPRHQKYYPSPEDWRDEVLYFLLVDRFSDAKEKNRPLLNRKNLTDVRKKFSNGSAWRWDKWSESGGDRWQGGNIKGVKSKLGYLKNLGITTIWLSPVFKQRCHMDTYHGYGIQDFLEVDPRFGSRNDLVDLVDCAHKMGLRIILDIIFNHSGSNWTYPGDTPGGKFTPYYTPQEYQFGHWLGAHGQEIDRINQREDAVWPEELQDLSNYTRAGSGNLGSGDIADPHAEHKRSDFITLRDFRLDAPLLLSDLARCYKYWIALTDCDGFRIDTLKHVPFKEARNFCGSIKEFTNNLGKKNFFLVGEIAGGDYLQDRYLDTIEHNLDAALDIGQMRITLKDVAKGFTQSTAYFNGFNQSSQGMGSHRNLGNKHVSILDDHDHVFGDKIRFSSEASPEHQVVAGVALQLYSLGIPCIYYGTEQAFSGPERSELKWLPDWKHNDRYLREAMFGPMHPKKRGVEGLPSKGNGIDNSLPGFGPFGTAGQHCFDENNSTYMRISALTNLRMNYPVLRYGRQYLRPISILGRMFNLNYQGEIIAWSRILDDEEAVCIINSHGVDRRGADILIDATLNGKGSEMKVLLNTAQAANPKGYSGSHPVRSSVPVLKKPNGIAYIEVRDVAPSEVLIFINYP